MTSDSDRTLVIDGSLVAARHGANELDHLFQFRPSEILPRRLIHEHPVEVNTIKLTAGVLIQNADSYISISLARHEALACCVRLNSKTRREALSNKTIPTLFRHPCMSRLTPI